MAIGTLPTNYGNAAGTGPQGEWQGTPGGGAVPENAQWPQNFGDPQVFGLSGGEGSGMSVGGYRPFTQKLPAPMYNDGTPSGTAQAGAVYTGYKGASPTRSDKAVSSLLPVKLENSDG